MPDTAPKAAAARSPLLAAAAFAGVVLVAAAGLVRLAESPSEADQLAAAVGRARPARPAAPPARRRAGPPPAPAIPENQIVSRGTPVAGAAPRAADRRRQDRLPRRG